MVWPDRKRRSCATIASCQAVSRAWSDAASAGPLLEPTIAYGFTSDHPFRRTYAPLPIELLLCPAAVTNFPSSLHGSTESGWRHAAAPCDLIPNRSGECRPCEQSAGRAVSVLLGVGVKATDPRSTPIAGIRTTDTALTKAGVADGCGEELHDKFARSTQAVIGQRVCDRARPPIEQIPIL